MTSIFHITGGLGKHVLFSSVLNSFKNAYPDKNIIVSSAYPEVFERNPNVSESLNLHKNQYFYKNYIKNKEVELFTQEPYKQNSHILEQKHIIETWCDMIGVSVSSLPTIHFNFRELEVIGTQISQHKNKPVLVFQPFGGPANQQQPYSWARDIHPNLAQKIVDSLYEKYNILHICNPHHPVLNNCVRIDQPMPCNFLFAILLMSDRRILIDSCLQHVACAFNLPSTVIWNVTSPKLFGYPIHQNILPPKNDLDGISSSYLFNYEIGGVVTECPFSKYEEMYDIDTIMEIIKNDF